MAIIKPAAITKIIQDVRRPLKDGTYPIKIRITFQRKQVYYRTPYSLSNIDFSEVMGKESTHGENKGSRIKKTKKEIKEISLELHEYENKAGNIIKELQVFTWTIFEKKFLTEGRKEFRNSFDQKLKIISTIILLIIAITTFIINIIQTQNNKKEIENLKFELQKVVQKTNLK